MKIITLIGVGLYSIANIFAGFFELAGPRYLPTVIAVMLILSGLLFALSFYYILKEKNGWFVLTISGLVLAFGIALFNERILGLGNPSHHIYRGFYSLLIMCSAYLFSKKEKKSTQPTA
jgi:presenilin-like A22 family membrane protease